MHKAIRGEAISVAVFAFVFVVLFWRVTLAGGALLPVDFLASFPPWEPVARETERLTQGQDHQFPHNELMGDMILQNYSWKTLIRDSYREVEFPLWNPYVMTGLPFLAGGQSGALYPLNVIFYLIPVANGYGWFTALHLFMGAVFMYLYLRVLGTGHAGSLLAGFVFSLCGFLTVSYQWPMMVSGAVWLPLLLLCIEMVVRRFEQERPVLGGALPWVLLGSFGLGMQVLAGHMETTFYVLFTLLTYSLFRLAMAARVKEVVKRLPVAVIALAAMAFLAIGLSAGQWIPFAELIRYNVRAGTVSFNDVASWALPTRQILAFFVPDIFGNPSHHSFLNVFTWKWEDFLVKDSIGQVRNYPFWGIKNYVEGTGYVGVLPIVLGILGILLVRNRHTVFFSFYAALSLSLAFGSPLYAVLFYGVPGFDQLHSPFRWVFPFSVSMAVLAGLGLDAMVRHGGKRTRLAVGLAAALAGVLLLFTLFVSRLLPDTSLEAVGRVMHASARLSQAFPSPEALYSYQWLNFLKLGLLLFAGGVAVTIARRWPKTSVAVLLALVVFDLGQFGYGYYTVSDPASLRSHLPFVDALERNEPFRIAAYGNRHTMIPNSGMLLGLQDIRGYDTVIPKQYVEFWRLMEEPAGLPYSQINLLTEESSLDSPILDIMNVKYLLTVEKVDRPNYSKVYDGEIKVYRNLDAIERAFVVFDARVASSPDDALKKLSEPGFDVKRQVVLEESSLEGFLPPNEAPSSQVNVAQYKNNRVSINVSASRDGFLVLSDAYFPGWRARLEDGSELDVMRANRVFRAVRVPAGDHNITFSYAPMSFRAGMFISFMASVSIVLGGVAWVWRRRLQGLVESSGARRVVKNSVTPMAAQLVSRFIDLGFTVVMLRLLGPHNYGNYAFAVALIGYFSIFTDFGLGTLLTREVSRDRGAIGKYLGNTMAIRVALCIASAPILLGILALYSWRFGLERETVIVTLLFMASLFPSSVAAAFSAAFSAYEKMEYPAIASILTTMVRASVGLLALAIGWGVVGLGVASVAASLASAILLALMFVRMFSFPKLELDLFEGREMTWSSLPLMINNLLSTIFFRIDVMLLQPMKGSQVLGYYSSAYKFVDGLNVFPSFVTLALFPVMSRRARSSREGLITAYTKALKVLFILAMPITLGTMIIAERLVLFLFGSEFSPAIQALQILIWFLPFSYVNSVTQYVIIAVEKQRFLTLAFVIGAAFNLLANLIAIPLFGLVGASVVTVLSELVLMAPFMWAVWRWVGPLNVIDLCARPVAATIVMGAVLFPLSHLTAFLLVPLGVTVYVLALLILRTFDDDDKAILRTIFARS